MSITTIAVTKPVGSGIIESGSNAYGEYEIYANGRIHMTGWGYVTWTSGAQYVSKTVTLPYECALRTAMRPQISVVAQKDVDPTTIYDYVNTFGMICSVYVASTTQLRAYVRWPSAVNETTRWLYSWEVWGTV